MRTLLPAILIAASLTGCPTFTNGPEPEFESPAPAAENVGIQVAPDSPTPPLPTPAAPPAGVKVRHLLVMYAGSLRAPPTVTRTKDEARARAQEALGKARAPGADFAALVGEYSDEPGAAERGGDLGTVTAETQFVEPFKSVALGLGPNAVSDLVETDFGFHVIQRYE